MKKRDTLVAKVIEHAESYVGLRSRAFKNNGFGAKTGFDGKPWDGSFLTVVFREAGVNPGVSLVSSTAALAFFNRQNSMYRNPKAGDIAFFAWSTDDDGFGPPHVGLVTEVRDWKSRGAFRTVEGQVNSGMPKSHPESDGLYNRTRYMSDVIGFARPVYMEIEPLTASTSVPLVLVSDVQVGKLTNANTLVQLALADYLGVFGFERARYDRTTQSAMLRFQKENGLVKGDGLPDAKTLTALARATGYRFFRTEA
jgi:hypothetical protein